MEPISLNWVILNTIKYWFGLLKASLKARISNKEPFVITLKTFSPPLSEHRTRRYYRPVRHRFESDLHQLDLNEGEDGRVGRGRVQMRDRRSTFGENLRRHRCQSSHLQVTNQFLVYPHPVRGGGYEFTWVLLFLLLVQWWFGWCPGQQHGDHSLPRPKKHVPRRSRQVCFTNRRHQNWWLDGGVREGCSEYRRNWLSFRSGEQHARWVSFVDNATF